MSISRIKQPNGRKQNRQDAYVPLACPKCGRDEKLYDMFGKVKRYRKECARYFKCHFCGHYFWVRWNINGTPVREGWCDTFEVPQSAEVMDFPGTLSIKKRPHRKRNGRKNRYGRIR